MCFSDMAQRVVMVTEAGSGVMVTLVSPECYLSGYWLKTWRSVNMSFLVSLFRLSLLVMIHLPFLSALPLSDLPDLSLICQISLSLSLFQALKSHKSSFPPLDWKSDLQCILKEFLALLAKLCQRKNTDRGHGKDKTKRNYSFHSTPNKTPPLEHLVYQQETSKFLFSNNYFKCFDSVMSVWYVTQVCWMLPSSNLRDATWLELFVWFVWALNAFIGWAAGFTCTWQRPHVIARKRLGEEQVRFILQYQGFCYPFGLK